MWAGLIVLCIAGTTTADLPDTLCIQYQSPLFEEESDCQRELAMALLSPELIAMVTLPEYDLEVVEASCSVAI